MKLSQPPESLSQNREDLIEKDAILLRRTAERLVRLGQQIGVTSEEMISLLDSWNHHPRLAGISSVEKFRSRLESAGQ